jgi:hypothetical protein
MRPPLELAVTNELSISNDEIVGIARNRCNFGDRGIRKNVSHVIMPHRLLQSDILEPQPPELVGTESSRLMPAAIRDF